MEGKVYKNNKEMIYFSIHIIFFVLTEMIFFEFLSEIINKFFLDFNIFFVLLPPSHKGCCNRLRLYP